MPEVLTRHTVLYSLSRKKESVAMRREKYTGLPEDIRIGLLGLKVKRAWVDMNRRCYSESNPRFSEYGGRGILVCEEWRKSFLQFYLDMGNPKDNTYQIDRIDNDKGYSKGNCRWATMLQNIHNSRVTKLTKDKVIEIKKLQERSTLKDAEIAAMFSVTSGTISAIRNKQSWAHLDKGSK